MNGGKFDMKNESGAGSVVFKLGAIQFETIPRDGNVLAGDIEETAANFEVVMLEESGADGAITGWIRRSAGQGVGGVSVIEARCFDKRFAVVIGWGRSDGAGEIARSEFGVTVPVKPGERGVVRFDAEALGRRLGNPLADGIEVVGTNPIVQIGQLIFGEFGERTIFSHCNGHSGSFAKCKKAFVDNFCEKDGWESTRRKGWVTDTGGVVSQWVSESVSCETTDGH